MSKPAGVSAALIGHVADSLRLRTAGPKVLATAAKSTLPQADSERGAPSESDILATVCGQLAGGRGPKPGYNRLFRLTSFTALRRNTERRGRADHVDSQAHIRLGCC